MSELAIFGDIRHAVATRGYIDLQRVYHIKGFSPFIPSWPLKVRQKSQQLYLLNLLPNSTYGLVAAVAKAPVYSKPKFYWGRGSNPGQSLGGLFFGLFLCVFLTFFAPINHS